MNIINSGCLVSAKFAILELLNLFVYKGSLLTLSVPVVLNWGALKTPCVASIFELQAFLAV